MAIIVVAFLAMRRRTSTPFPAAGPSGYFPVASASPAMFPGSHDGSRRRWDGSGLLGSLATGAAIGGGIVAGEALANRLIGGHTSGAAGGRVDEATFPEPCRLGR